MKRRFSSLIVLAVLALACAPTPPERASLPKVDAVLDPPVQCTFLIGDPQGVLVDEIIPNSASDGLLLPGDVIVAVEGESTDDSDALLGVLEDSLPGDTIDVNYLRNGTDTTTTLTLGSNPDDSSRPMIGVMIRTSYQTVQADEVGTSIEGSPSARAIAIGGTIYLADPLTTEWARTDVDVEADPAWIATTSGIYSMEEDTVVDLQTGEPIPNDRFEEWEPLRIIGSIGDDLLLAVTRPVPDEIDQVVVGVTRFDPAEARTEWVSPSVDGFGIPVLALSAADEETIVVVGVNEDGSEVMGVALWDGEGITLSPEVPLTLGTPAGWMDDNTLLFRTEEAVATELEVGTGESAEVTLDPQIAGLPVFPVGDGRHVLAVDGQTLLLDDLDDGGEVRVLAQDCAISRLGNPGRET